MLLISKNTGKSWFSGAYEELETDLTPKSCFFGTLGSFLPVTGGYLTCPMRCNIAGGPVHYVMFIFNKVYILYNNV